MKKFKIKFQLPSQFDWESPDFIKTGLRLLEEAQEYDLFREESRPRIFKEELQLWTERWKRQS